MKNRIITISREFGSGGRTIGKEVAAKLGIPCYDQELIEKIAQESGFAKEYVAERGEYSSHGNWFASAFSDRDFNGHSHQDDLWAAQRNVILELADKGPCVIVGRCGDYILREKADCLTVFIHADMEHRAKRIVEQYGEGKDAPEKRLQDKDKRRAAYYQFYTDMKWGKVQNYHIALDSGVLGIKTCVELLAGLY
ncbi:MAG: cytidylate kinase-like family protein [Lachnospiraceae bacterium]|nr:cytidylate kinase-like family protein [Lachnospiraceae bacterium]